MLSLTKCVAPQVDKKFFNASIRRQHICRGTQEIALGGVVREFLSDVPLSSDSAVGLGGRNFWADVNWRR